MVIGAPVLRSLGGASSVGSALNAKKMVRGLSNGQSSFPIRNCTLMEGFIGRVIPTRFFGDTRDPEIRYIWIGEARLGTKIPAMEQLLRAPSSGRRKKTLARVTMITKLSK